ncbi:uncharacterized protein LOC115050039 isoform X3 [Echeneis naucrates]|uniref:uncharacterized protein LOC115050039 isoform X3 n=1 Tax=Echeneis naucrates TaxID=173247 RepID=UPI001113CC91|nr:uncharacterized protein LOC115050039 isoform X3 [Echeneis naucrates]
MRLVLYLLLILRVGRCSDKQMIVMIPVGDKVSLTCEFRDIGKVLWMKIVSGNLPQILKRTNSEQKLLKLQLPHLIQQIQKTQFFYSVRPSLSLRRQNIQKKRACTKTWNCSFSNVFSSNASTHCCAAVTCGQIFSGGSSKKKCGAENVCNSQTDNTVLFLLCAALALSLSVIACLLYSTNKRKQNSQCNYAAVALNATAGANQERQQTDEDSLVYSAPAFIDRQASTSKARTRDAKSEEEEEDTIYTNIKTLEMD